MMREKTIEKIIREFIAKELTISPDKIELEANLVNDLHADSMDIVNVEKWDGSAIRFLHKRQ